MAGTAAQSPEGDSVVALRSTPAFGRDAPTQAETGASWMGHPAVQPVGGSTSVAPSITTQPSSQTQLAGAAATFTSAAGGSPSPTVQWYRGGTAISEATSASYTTGVLTTADTSAVLYAIWTNTAGTAQTANATVTVNAAPTTTPRFAGNIGGGGNRRAP